jgi:hypothetical protein
VTGLTLDKDGKVVRFTGLLLTPDGKVVKLLGATLGVGRDIGGDPPLRLIKRLGGRQVQLDLAEAQRHHPSPTGRS